MNKENKNTDNLPSVDELCEITATFLEGGLTFKHLKNISDDDMEGIYSVGYSLYNNGKYDDAEKVFQFLTYFDHYSRKYWMGLGATWQMAKKHKKATEAYAMATLLDVHDPMPYLHAADCLLAQGDVENAKSALMGAVKYSGKSKEIKERAQALLDFLNKDESK